MGCRSLVVGHAGLGQDRQVESASGIGPRCFFGHRINQAAEDPQPLLQSRILTIWSEDDRTDHDLTRRMIGPGRPMRRLRTPGQIDQSVPHEENEQP